MDALVIDLEQTKKQIADLKKIAEKLRDYVMSIDIRGYPSAHILAMNLNRGYTRELLDQMLHVFNSGEYIIPKNMSENFYNSFALSSIVYSDILESDSIIRPKDLSFFRINVRRIVDTLEFVLVDLDKIESVKNGGKI